MENRKYSRINLDLPGTLETDVNGLKKSYRVHVRDVSLKGAFVELANYEVDPQLFISKKYTLTISLQATIKIVMKMICRHVSGHSLGLECENIDSNSIAHLKRLVEMNLGRSDILNRELSVLLKTNA